MYYLTKGKGGGGRVVDREGMNGEGMNWTRGEEVKMMEGRELESGGKDEGRAEKVA